MLADMIIIGAGAGISALANGPAMLFVGQLLVGVGVGIDFPVSGTYLSEVLPERSRARMMVATIACQSVGMLVAAAITLLLLGNVGSAQNWRLFLAMEGIIAILFFLLRLSVPDSPHWLMTRGKFARAAHVFIHIMPEQREASALSPTSHAREKSLANSVAPAKAPRFSILFSRPYRARTVLVAVPWFLMDIATYGVGLFTPIILGAIDISGQTGTDLPRPRQCQGKRRNRFVPVLWFSAWNPGSSPVRTHPDAGHRVLQHWLWACSSDDCCSPVEFQLAHSARVRRFHPVQPVDERRT